MAAPSGTFIQSRFSRPSSRSPGGPVFAVGRQAFVNGPAGARRPIPLNDEKATCVVGDLSDGTEVEILGWLPAGNGTRYHVRSTDAGTEGWLNATSLRRTLDRRAAVATVAPKTFVSIAAKPPTGRAEAAAAAEAARRPSVAKAPKRRERKRAAVRG